MATLVNVDMQTTSVTIEKELYDEIMGLIRERRKKPVFTTVNKSHIFRAGARLILALARLRAGGRDLSQLYSLLKEEMGEDGVRALEDLVEALASIYSYRGS